jgi:phosphatidylserine/phosphatidylglycerophosphate/cardiolipin synthase-like enzyme
MPQLDPLDPVREAIAAHRDALALPGVLSVRAGYEVRDGWPVTPPVPAIVVTVAAKSDAPPGGQSLPAYVGEVPVDVRQASARKRRWLEAGAPEHDPGRAPDTGALPDFADETSPRLYDAGPVARPAQLLPAAAKPQLPYAPPAGVGLTPVSGVVTVHAAASPDAGWGMLASFLSGVTEHLTIGLYDWTSAHVLQAFTDAMPGVTVDLVLDHPAPNPSADQSDEATVAALRSAFGDRLRQAWALERQDPKAAAWQFPSAYHIKVAVADHAWVWLSSGNWNNSNQPAIDPVTVPGDRVEARTRDRDWHLVIESPQLAATFEAYLLGDLEVALQHQAAPAPASAGEGETRTVQTPPFTQFFAATTVSEQTTIQPVLTPDAGGYADRVRDLIASATTSLSMQFQYIEIPKDPASESAGFTELIDAVVARQQAGVAVRIIMSEYETQGYLEKLVAAGLDLTAVRIQNNVHNKGIVVDDHTVLVSSQNWSVAGTTTNRDAGVIVTDATLATYFQQIFDHDWAQLATQQAAED